MSGVVLSARISALASLASPTLERSSVFLWAGPPMATSISLLSRLSTGPNRRRPSAKLDKRSLLPRSLSSFRTLQPFNTHRAGVERRFSPIHF